MEVVLKKIMLISSVIVLGTLFLISGCSDKSTDGAITEGDYSDEDFLLARAEADSTLEDIRIDNFGARDWICREPTGPEPPYMDSVTYDSLTGWHVWELLREDPIVQFSVIDSFRFTDLNSNYQRFCDSTTNVFERRLKKDFHAERGRIHNGTEWDRNLRRNTIWDGLADSVTTLNGDFNRYWSGESIWRDFEKTVDGEMTDIQFHTEDLRPLRYAHPFDGVFEAWMVMDMELPRRQAHIEAHLVVTFFEGGYHAYLERGNNWWEWTHYWPE
jgi:hypothetical protein